MKLRFPKLAPITWLMGVIWLLIALWGNTPFFQPHPETNPQYDLRGYWVQPQKFKNPLPYEFTSLVGWPVEFMQVEKPMNQVCQFNPAALFVDFVATAVAITCVMLLTERWSRKFTIRHLFVLMTVVALLLAIVPGLLPDYGLVTFHYVMAVIYFFPVVILAIQTFWNERKHPEDLAD